MLSKIKCLNGFQLKIIAAVLMVLDHIYYFFINIYKVPVIFTQLGRLSAPIFLFLLVEGFFHTKNRIKYFLQIYIFSVFMGIVRIALMLGIDGIKSMPPFPLNGILSTFTVLIAAMLGLEMIKNHKPLGYAVFFAVIILPYFANAIAAVPYFRTALYILNETVLPMHPFVQDGGTLFVLAGLALYFFRGNVIKQTLAFIAVSLIDYFSALAFYGISFSAQDLLYPYHQWMMIFAAAFFFLYNGKRGKGSKWFFYIFYPAHVYILYGIAVYLYLSH